MGAYLSQPKTEKFSTDEVNDLLMVGASSMQGWRNSQEDAHNCILNFDASTSFFAVYDGHGGAEVANYCADKLPHFLRDSGPYKSGHLEKALKSAFLEFDKTLLDAEVVEVLKILAGEKNFVEDSDVMEEDEDDEDLAELREEGNLPLDEVLEKYKGGASMPALKKVKDCEPRPSGSKPQSPYLRGRRAAAVAADAANKAEIDAEINAQSLSNCSTSNDNAAGTSKSILTKGGTGSAEDDSTVSSSSSGVCKSNNNNNNNNSNNKNTAMVTSKEAEAEAEAEASEPQKATTNGCATSSLPDSSHIKDSEQNGNVTSSESKTLKEVVSTSTNEHCVKSAIEDDIVSGSNEATENEQNGNVDNSTASTLAPMKSIEKTDLSAISSTSKDGKKMKKSSLDDDSTDEDVDFDVDDASSNEDVDPHHSLDYSSDEEGDDDDEDEDDDDVDDGDDEEDDDDDDEDDENILSSDQLCTSMIEEPGKDSGCTAVVALLRGRDLYVANAGDSRCVVARKGKAIEMSLDHKPEDEEESARIVKAGGRVTLDGRVNGGLNLSRALGDHAYKMNYDLSPEEQMISALPDIKKLIITPDDEFMVLACDGIWNFMSSEEVVEFVRSRLVDDTKKLSQICEDLFDNCLAPNTMGDGTGCDNMTAVIVRFQGKVLEMPTEININETEDVLVSKKSAAEAEGEMSAQKTLKRCASPNSDDSCNEAENVKTKRAKTDDELGELQTSSSNDATSSSSSSVSKSTHADAEQSECDSLNTVNNEATAAALST